MCGSLLLFWCVSFFLSVVVSFCLSFVCLWASAGVLGTSWKPLASLLELPAGVPERLRTAVAHVTANFPLTVASCVRLGCVFASSWRCLGASWARLGRVLARLGAAWRRLSATWAHFGASWARLGATWAPYWAVLGASCRVLEPSLGVLEPS